MTTNTKLKLKKSSVVGRIPASGDLEYGEVAINYADGKLYYKHSSNAVKAFLDQSSISIFIDSDYVQARSAAIADANTVILNEYTGDSSTTAFALTHSPTTDHHAIVMVDGVVQQVNTYSLAGSQLTLDEAPVSGSELEVRTLRVQTGSVTVRDHANYVFQPITNTTIFSDSDINSQILTYDINKLDVYKNGVRLVNGLDYTASTGTSVTLLGGAAVTTATNQVVDAYNKTVSRTAKYVIQMTQGSRYHSQEVLLVHDGTTVSMVEYADIYTESDLGTVDASISGDLVRLQVSPTYTNTTVKTNRIEVDV